MNIKIQFEAEIVKVLIDFCSRNNNNRVDDDGKRFKDDSEKERRERKNVNKTSHRVRGRKKARLDAKSNSLQRCCCAIIIFPSAKLDVFYQIFNINSISRQREDEFVIQNLLRYHVRVAPETWENGDMAREREKKNNQIKILPMKIET